MRGGWRPLPSDPRYTIQELRDLPLGIELIEFQPPVLPPVGGDFVQAARCGQTQQHINVDAQVFRYLWKIHRPNDSLT